MSKKQVLVRSLPLGGGAPVVIQSMLCAPSYDIPGNVRQAKALEAAGCELLRVAIPNTEALALIPALREAVAIPLVADIHFDYHLALGAAERGIDKIRINPGNIGAKEHVYAVAESCARRGIPIRIGVNSGSVEKKLLARYGGPSAEAMVESAARHIALLEECDFHEIVLSLKSSKLSTMIAAYRLAAARFDYPLHLGVTEAGTERAGLIKSSIGIGSLLADGIGDTIRVSLTADPVLEIAAARDILRALGLRGGVNVISCPTCGRTRIDVISLAHRVEEALSGEKRPLTVAVMGCAVNGPGEAREADIGIAGGDGMAVLFEKGEIIGRVDEDKILETLLARIRERADT